MVTARMAGEGGGQVQVALLGAVGGPRLGQFRLKAPDLGRPLVY
jgi:hypothetical protein